MTMKEYLTIEHRECDEILSDVENLVHESGLSSATDKFNFFENEMIRHFLEEEDVLFPAFEQKTGMSGGPTHVMRMEHNMMRQNMSLMRGALEDGNEDRFLGICETLMILIQQHNMKEEQMLYNMAQMHLSDQNEALIEQMKSIKV